MLPIPCYIKTLRRLYYLLLCKNDLTIITLNKNFMNPILYDIIYTIILTTLTIIYKNLMMTSLCKNYITVS